MQGLDKSKSKAVLVLVALTVLAGSARVLRRPAGKPATTGAPEPNLDPPTAARPPEPTALDDTRVVPEDLTLIDDMASANNAIDGPGLIGYWYAYSDGTGTTNPRGGARLFPSTKHDGKLAREFSGSGQTDWGAGFGFDVTKSGTIPPRANAVTTPFDASAYSGIRFDAMASGTPRLVEVTFSDADTNPHGGVCDPRATKNEPCNIDFAARAEFPAGGWRTFTLEFSKLALPEWVVFPAATQHGFQKDKLYSIHFQIGHVAASQTAVSDFDVFVANIYFVR